MKSKIVIHHSLTQDSGTVSWGAIERYHTQTMGWADIGYHFGVELIGDTYYSLLGRAEHKVAAAVREGDLNKTGIHICMVGNFDLAPPPEAMMDCLIRRVLYPVMDRWSIGVDDLYGHNNFATYKTCPGTKFPMEALKDRLRKLL